MIAITGLCRINLPTGVVVRICDGGVIRWGSEVYRGADPLFGPIAVIEALDEGVGTQVPAMQVDFRPPASAALADLARPSYQTAQSRFWIAEYDLATGAVTGTPELQFFGQLDQMKINLRRELSATVVSRAERLFAANRGSALNPAIHKQAYPGETGEDQATGLTRPVAWGTQAPPATVSTAVSSGMGVGAYAYQGRYAQ